MEGFPFSFQFLLEDDMMDQMYSQNRILKDRVVHQFLDNIQEYLNTFHSMFLLHLLLYHSRKKKID